MRRGKGTLRKAIYEHVRQSSRHAAESDKAELLARLLGQRYRTVSTDRETSQKFGICLLGSPEAIPVLPPDFENSPQERRLLAQSVAALGQTVAQWTTDDALAFSPQYRDVVKLFLSEASVGCCPDIRHLLTSTKHLTMLKARLDKLFMEKVPKAQITVVALVALVRRLEGRLVFLHDGLRVS